MATKKIKETEADPNNSPKPKQTRNRKPKAPVLDIDDLRDLISANEQRLKVEKGKGEEADDAEMERMYGKRKRYQTMLDGFQQKGEPAA